MDNKKKYYRNIADSRFNLSYEIHGDELYKYSKEYSPTKYSYPPNSITSALDGKLINFEGESVSQNKILEDSTSYIIIGLPGAGKTTLVKKMIYKIISNESTEYKYLPLLLKGREFSDQSIYNQLNNILLRKESYHKNEIHDILNSRSFILFIDGLDEIAGNKKMILAELNEIKEIKNGIKIIVTSRMLKELKNLNGFIELQLSNPNNIDMLENAGFDSKFISLIRTNKLEDLISSPLIFTTLYDLYKHYGGIPTSRISINKYILELLLGKWDESRNIKRIVEVDSGRKYQFLSFLAFYITFELNKETFNLSKDNPNSINQKQFNLGLSNSSFSIMLDEIINDSGIIRQVGHDKFSFLHKSFKEYLAAEYLILLPKIPVNNFVKHPEIYALAALLSSNKVEFEKYIFSELKTNKIKIPKKVLDNYFNILDNQKIK